MAPATTSFQALVDSSAFIARLSPEDPFHSFAKQAFQAAKQQSLQLVTTNLVVGETLTVLSHRGGHDLAKLFLMHLERSGLPVIFVDDTLHQETIKVFTQQEKKGTSFVDCANLVVIRKFSIPRIFGFDAFYKQHGCSTLP